MIRPVADDSQALLTRRRWLQRAGGGLRPDRPGGVAPRARACSAAESAAADASLNPMAARPGHFPGRAKRVIWIFTNGGPSQVDTWEYKPALERWHGKSMREFDPSFKNTTGLLQEPGRGADEVAVPVHAPGRVAARWSRRSSRTWAGTSTRWRSCTRSSPSRTTTRRRSS